MAYIIDRRKNPSGKSLVNRQRFMRRTRAAIKETINDIKNKTKIKDFDSKGGAEDDKVSVTIAKHLIHEPSFHFDHSTGDHFYVLPGNKNTDPVGYQENDLIPKPKGSGGAGTKGSRDGEGEDDFRFILSSDELNELYFEDCELPNEEERKLKETDTFEWSRAGYTVDGSPSNLNILRTVKNALGRRIALKRPKPEDIARLEEEDDTAEGLEELELQKKRMRLIPYIDTYDVRYNNFEAHPKPTSQSVMFCLMDVSGSMTQHQKDVAKHFFALLYRFLTTKYKKVEVVFIRHTHEAKEVDEETFFYDPETGGTVVSEALKLMNKIIDERFPLDDWNIYGAQASDGDNTWGEGEEEEVDSLMTGKLIPKTQYYAYLEIERNMNNWYGYSGRGTTVLWGQYKKYVEMFPKKFVMKLVKERKDIWTVFYELFKKKGDA